MNDPSTEEVIAQVPTPTPTTSIAPSPRPKPHSKMGPGPPPPRRSAGRVLFRLAEKIRQNAAMLAELESRNSGKPIVEAEFDIADVATCFEYYGGLATKILGHVNPVPDNAMSLTLKEPIGVAGQIIPWNYPLLMAAWKLAPALAAGCTCVLKPAEQTPLTALEMANWLRRGRVASRRGQHRHRLWRELWRAAGAASRREQDRLHRQRGGGQDHRQAGRRHGEAGHARARRQVSQHLFCRCGF